MSEVLKVQLNLSDSIGVMVEQQKILSDLLAQYLSDNRFVSEWSSTEEFVEKIRDLIEVQMYTVCTYHESWKTAVINGDPIERGAYVSTKTIYPPNGGLSKLTDTYFTQNYSMRAFETYELACQYQDLLAEFLRLPENQERVSRFYTNGKSLELAVNELFDAHYDLVDDYPNDAYEYDE